MKKYNSFEDPVEESEGNGVLILNTQSNVKRPLITNLAGHEITNFEFTFDDNTEVSYSCPLLWKNENFIRYLTL